jgi:hypothetical protein
MMPAIATLFPAIGRPVMPTSLMDVTAAYPDVLAV